MKDEFSRWLEDAFEVYRNQARAYLEAHPEEGGVGVKPSVVSGDEIYQLETIYFRRKDLGL